MTNIFDKLKFTGIEIGSVQSVDEMSVVPILGGDRGNISDPEALSFVGTSEYGTMVFENEGDNPAIVPTNMMARGPRAQDHAMSSSGIVMKGRKSFYSACCIEQTQGGHLTRENNELDVLPIQLRKDLVEETFRKASDYSKLWGKISDWLRGLPTNHRGSAHLRYFYDTPDIKTALEDFASEFEPVDGQIGAIIMFCGVPVGIEIMPSSRHWEAYWKLLIRGCYGAELMRLKMLGKVKESALILPEIPAGSDPEKVEEIISNFSLHLRQNVLPILEKINIKSQKLFYKEGPMSTSLITTNGGGGGDLILQGSVPVYLSLVL